MKISTKGRYALRAMISLVKSGGLGNVKSISEEEGLSAKYLEAIFSKLSKYKLVKGKRGPSGGYVLAVDAKQISCYDILNAMGDELVITDCTKRNEKVCKKCFTCPTRPVWKRLDTIVSSFFKGVSLADLSGDKLWE
jgi:Rrf2 family protein